MIEKNYIFVGGSPRSGTSALAHLINANRFAMIGMERFSPVWKKEILTPDDFSVDNFFKLRDYDVGRVNVQRLMTENSREKYTKSRLVGDKYPYITEHAEYIYRVFGGAKIVVILRHPYGVCESIKRRFEDPADKFNLSPEQGLRRWNRCLVDVMKSYKDGQKIYIVNYDKIFLNTDAIKIMYDVLGLSLTEADQSRLNSIIKKAEQLKSTESGISEEIIDLVDRKADFNLYRELLNFKCILKDY